ncbi:MAG: hypothetical protein IJV83_03520 [Clostridia bacterium]|nr:hypothetical protein [Clostridia bacterium]
MQNTKNNEKEKIIEIFLILSVVCNFLSGITLFFGFMVYITALENLEIYKGLCYWIFTALFIAVIGTILSIIAFVFEGEKTEWRMWTFVGLLKNFFIVSICGIGLIVCFLQ